MTNPYDMIERLMAVQAAPADWDEYHAGQKTIKDAVQVIGELADQVERLQAERRWIPVTERLPAVDEPVFVFTVDERKDIANRTDDDGWWIGEWTPLNYITHWQPLPAGPEGG